MVWKPIFRLTVRREKLLLLYYYIIILLLLTCYFSLGVKSSTYFQHIQLAGSASLFMQARKITGPIVWFPVALHHGQGLPLFMQARKITGPSLVPCGTPLDRVCHCLCKQGRSLGLVWFPVALHWTGSAIVYASKEDHWA